MNKKLLKMTKKHCFSFMISLVLVRVHMLNAPRQDRSNGTLHSQNGIKMPEKRRTDTQTYTSRLYTQIRIIFRKIFHSVSYIRMQDTKLISQRYLTPWSDAFPYNLSETLVVNASTFPSCVCVMSILAWLFSGTRAKLPSLL